MKVWEFHILKEWNGKSLQDVISMALEISRGEAKRLLDQKCVFVNNRRTWMAKHLVKVGDHISVSPTSGQQGQDSVDEVFLERAKLYEDKHLIIFNKPAGKVSNGAGSFEAVVQRTLKDRSIKAVHRLDKDTSGCLIFARSQLAWDAMYELFKDKSLLKVYHVLAVGKLIGKEKTITAPIDGKEAVSVVRSLKLHGDISLLEVVIETGRTHQIRKHLLSIGLPVLGDKEYTSKRSEASRFRGIDRQMLHAWKLSFKHPFGGKKLEVKAPYPDDFKSIADNGI